MTMGQTTDDGQMDVGKHCMSDPAINSKLNICTYYCMAEKSCYICSRCDMLFRGDTCEAVGVCNGGSFARTEHRTTPIASTLAFTALKCSTELLWCICTN